MAYVEAHSGLREHPKTKKASRMLGISRVQMIGHLLCLWWWCQEYAQDGNLSQFESDDIALAADWEGDAESFVNSLLRCGTKGNAGFLARNEDDDVIINDWYQYGGKLFVKRAQGTERQRRKRENERDVTRDSRVTDTNVTHTSPNVTHIDKIRSEEIREDESIKDFALSAPLAAQPENPQNGKVEEPLPVETIKTPKPVRAKTPKPLPVEDAQPTGQQEMFGALCLIIYGHSTYKALSGKNKAQLGTESSNLLKIGATPELVASWYKEKWRTTWPGNKGTAPSFEQVRNGVASFIEKQNGTVIDIDFDAPPATYRSSGMSRADLNQAAIDRVFDALERGEVIGMKGALQ